MHGNSVTNLGIFLQHSKFYIHVQFIIFTTQAEMNILQAY